VGGRAVFGAAMYGVCADPPAPAPSKTTQERANGFPPVWTKRFRRAIGGAVLCPSSVGTSRLSRPGIRVGGSLAALEAPRPDRFQAAMCDETTQRVEDRIPTPSVGTRIKTFLAG
jgi:hypothetical protein